MACALDVEDERGPDGGDERQLLARWECGVETTDGQVGDLRIGEGKIIGLQHRGYIDVPRDPEPKKS